MSSFYPTPSRIVVEYSKAQILGKELRRARLFAGFTQKELAHQLGRLTPYISGVERGEDDIDPTTMWRWNAACGIITPQPAHAPLSGNVAHSPPSNPTAALLALIAPHRLAIPPHRDILRGVRRNAKLSQPKLAQLLNCTASYVCQVERGKCGITEQMARDWLRACGIVIPA